MDMNDILAQWDKIQANDAKKNKEQLKKQVSHKKANAPTALEKELLEEKKFFNNQGSNNKNINPMETWLRRYGVVDKDKIAEEENQNKNYADRNYLLNMKPQARLDLHGLHQDEAYERINYFIGDCIKRGIKKVIIIHGKGIHTTGTDPVLGELVRKFIENDSRCGMSGHPKNKEDGGTGATWIILKK